MQRNLACLFVYINLRDFLIENYALFLQKVVFSTIKNFYVSKFTVIPIFLFHNRSKLFCNIVKKKVKYIDYFRYRIFGISAAFC